MNPWLAVVVLLASSPPIAARKAVSPLSRHVSHFSVGKTTALEALIWLGRNERLCFGIEVYGPELSKAVQIKMDDTTVGAIVTKILSAWAPTSMKLSSRPSRSPSTG